jgi:LacI family transcriptional regulator
VQIKAGKIGHISHLSVSNTLHENIEVTEQLLRRKPDLVALYVAGGGLPGALDALQASVRARSIVTVGNAMTEHTKLGRIENGLTMIFAHPIQRLAAEAITQMQRDIAAATPPGMRLINFDIFGPENI